MFAKCTFCALNSSFSTPHTLVLKNDCKKSCCNPPIERNKRLTLKTHKKFALLHWTYCILGVDYRTIILPLLSLNNLTNLTNLSPENQRQRRHLFLKELNLKLFLIFNIRESIIRYDDENDKRIKIYKLSDQISPDMISKALNMEA